MSDLTLKSLDITNFRSIRGHIHAPLDANVVLVHGENGAGKTSLLSAIELALTGGIQSLQHADPAYGRQLLHRSTGSGSVIVDALESSGARRFEALLTAEGAKPVATLSDSAAAFFRERAFLPQSLLGQLLQIYQDSSDGLNSPLARFVGKLLGLDRLDALEAGLKPLNDVRNVRKYVDGWLAAEGEKTRLEKVVADHRALREVLDGQIRTELGSVATQCATLNISIAASEENLEAIGLTLSDESDRGALTRVAGQQRELAAIRRQIQAARVGGGGTATPALEGEDPSVQYTTWQAENGAPFEALRRRIETLLSESLPAEFDRFADDALSRLNARLKQLSERAAQGRTDDERHAKAHGEREVAKQQRASIDNELLQISSSAGSLSAALAEVSSFITDDICPVCDRNFSEIGDGSLGDHVHAKVRTLSASAERLLALGRSRGEIQIVIERLDREIEVLETRRLQPEQVAEIERQAAAFASSISELEARSSTLREGERLRAADVTARRIVTEAQSRNLDLAAARGTLSAFALAAGATDLADGESFEAGVERLDHVLTAEISRLERRLDAGRRAREHIDVIKGLIPRRQAAQDQLDQQLAALTRIEEALERAQAVREQANAVRGVVDSVRSAIIRREFNDRLNRLWRDLFVRLAPGEPFVPAFRVPESSTQRLQPKLITEHRDGGEAGGTPGAMLSSGNLNTAALTLFTALHLSVPKELPWLLLDDPVQSMDDVHIAHFAALLRTLSKEHSRQVMIAVHDRQLFEYLRLELSPAFPDDSLLTLELSRGPRRDTLCVSQRYSFKEETVLLSAA